LIRLNGRNLMSENMRFVLTTLLLLCTFSVFAEDPWGSEVDLNAAKVHHEKACVACHLKMYGSDGSKMYTRDGRVLSNKLELLQRVSSCNAMMSSGWFPEEEGSVAAWLNKHYYHFEN
jgi:hypothetical protein